MTWDPAQYHRFREERQKPFFDLLALVRPRPSMRVLDLGCGSGELTRRLHDTLGAEKTLGVDNSAEMLAASAAHQAPGLEFQQAAIESVSGDERWDLVFSNAALHWVRDHPALLTRLRSLLGPEGQMAVQMPANDDHASHTTAAAVARRYGIEPRHDPLRSLEHYAALLHQLGFAAPVVRAQIYSHILPSSADVVEWVRGTLLTEYQRQLPAEDFPRFLQDYADALRQAIGVRENYLYTYRRIFLWAQLP